MSAISRLSDVVTKATPGPWSHGGNWFASDPADQILGYMVDVWPNQQENLAVIVALYNAWPAIADVLRAAEAAVGPEWAYGFDGVEHCAIPGYGCYAQRANGHDSDCPRGRFFAALAALEAVGGTE